MIRGGSGFVEDGHGLLSSGKEGISNPPSHTTLISLKIYTYKNLSIHTELWIAEALLSAGSRCLSDTHAALSGFRYCSTWCLYFFDKFRRHGGRGNVEDASCTSVFQAAVRRVGNRLLVFQALHSRAISMIRIQAGNEQQFRKDESCFVLGALRSVPAERGGGRVGRWLYRRPALETRAFSPPKAHQRLGVERPTLMRDPIEEHRELLEQFFLEAFPNPDRIGCPDEDAFEVLAENGPGPDDPVLHHVASCSECYREYRHYRREHAERKAGLTQPLPRLN